jgi:hypothetical protein
VNKNSRQSCGSRNDISAQRDSVAGLVLHSTPASAGNPDPRAVARAPAELDAIRRGDHIAIESAGSLFNLAGVKYARPSEQTDSTSFRIQMAYRQAGLFVAFLHEMDPAGFARMMDAVMDGRPFAECVTTGYRADLQALWSRFVEQLTD